MIKNILIAAVILITIALAYSMGKKQDNEQVNDLKTQINTLRDQLNVQGKNLESSYHRLHRSLNLHMAETSIETAIHETLDQNFGQAKAAVDSAQKYLKGAQGSFIRPSDLTPITKELDSVTEQLAHLDKGAIKSLNDADRLVRELIMKNSR
jgi:hypothetical protein